MIAFSDLEVLRTRAREKKERSVAGPVQSTRRRISRSITSRAFNSAAAVAPAATDAEDVSEFGLAVIRAHHHSAAVAEAVENQRNSAGDAPRMHQNGGGGGVASPNIRRYQQKGESSRGTAVYYR